MPLITSKKQIIDCLSSNKNTYGVQTIKEGRLYKIIYYPGFNVMDMLTVKNLTKYIKRWTVADYTSDPPKPGEIIISV